MEIGYLISQYPARSHTFIRREIAEIRKRGAVVRIFALRRCGRDELLSDLDRQAYDETWSIVPAPLPGLLCDHAAALFRRPGRYIRTLRLALRHRLPGLRNLVWTALQFGEAIRLAAEVRRRGLKHLHVHFSNAGANVALLTAEFCEITWSMTLHGACDIEYPAGPLLGPKLESVRFSNCSSHFIRAQALRTIGPEHWAKVFVSRCGIDLSAIPEHVERDESPGRAVRIICVGRLSSEKGQLGLLEAFAHALAGDIDAELVLVGDGPDRKLVEQRIAELGLGDHCTLLGSLAEAECLSEIGRADILALASFMEGVPLVLMEAMVQQVPVIAPRLSGIPELVRHERSGLLFDPADWKALGDAITALARDPAKRLELGREGRAKVLDEFVIHRAVDPLWAAFQALEGTRSEE